MSANPFPRWALFLIAGVGGTSLALAILGGTLAPMSPLSREGPSAFSRSALGHRALAELLRRLDVPVLVSRYDSGRRSGADGVLVLAEPDVAVPDLRGDMERALRGAKRVLLVLPKWKAERSPDHPGWVRNPSLLSPSDVRRVLDAAGVESEVGRGPAVPAGGWTAPGFRFRPRLPGPQCIRSGLVRPLVSDGDRILLGEASTPERTLWILADPDPIANHGLGRDENAAFAVEILEGLRKGTGAVVFDETLHGLMKRPGPLDALLVFPLSLVTLQGVLAAALFLWAAAGRFGAPAPAARALPPGHRFLIENTAALWDFGGHAVSALWRYLRNALRDAAVRFRAPPDADPDEWLGRIADARGVSAKPHDLRREAEEATGRPRGPAIVAAALRIHRWRQEMIHGRSGHSGAA